MPCRSLQLAESGRLREQANTEKREIVLRRERDVSLKLSILQSEPERSSSARPRLLPPRERVEPSPSAEQAMIRWPLCSQMRLRRVAEAQQAVEQTRARAGSALTPCSRRERGREVFAERRASRVALPPHSLVPSSGRPTKPSLNLQ